MPKRKKQSHDFSIIAHRVVQEATGQDEDSTSESTPEQETVKPDYAALGRAGGKKGGKARAEKLTPEQRSEIARKAAQARWSQSNS